MNQLKFTFSLKPLWDMCTNWLSWRAGRESIWLVVMTYGPSIAQRSECHDRKSNISHPARPNSVITHFIVWLFSVGNFDFFFLKYHAIDRRARNNHKNYSTINTFPFCFRVRTGNSHFIEKRGICFHLYPLLSLIFGHKSGQCFSF